jgi:2-oxo-3-hexenedioate decarboxylase
MTDRIEARARQIVQALTTPKQITPASMEPNSLSLEEAYAVAAQVQSLQGRQRVGLKVGFTNRSIWPVYGVDRPIWGEIYADGLFATNQPVPLAGFSEPRIEPEIVLGFRDVPSAEMDGQKLKDCIEWVAPGFEIVQSIYPNWTFSVEDSIAAQALHGCLVLGEKIPATAEVLSGLPAVPLQLRRAGETVENGKGVNALGGPIDVLAHLTPLLSEERALKAGELLTTGTLTDAWPVSPGECWSAYFGGVMAVELTVQFK